MRSRLFLLLTLTTSAASLVAQTASLPPVRPPATSAEASTRLRYAARLPIRTTELRNSGVHDTTIHRLLEVFRQRGIAPSAVDSILLVERDAARENGPTDNFGAFVQTQLDAGLRGQELAAAIRYEHETRGHGNGPVRAKRDQQRHERARAELQSTERRRP